MRSDNLEPAGKVPEWVYNPELRAPGTDDEPAFDPRVRAGWLVPLALACVVLGIVVGRALS